MNEQEGEYNMNLTTQQSGAAAYIVNIKFTERNCGIIEMKFLTDIRLRM